MKTRISSVAAAGVAMALATAAYPANFVVENNYWAPGTEPESKCHLGPYSTGVITVNDADQLQRVLTNIEALNGIRGAEDGAGWLLHFDDGKAEEQATAATGGDGQPAASTAPQVAEPQAPATAGATATADPAASTTKVASKGSK